MCGDFGPLVHGNKRWGAWIIIHGKYWAFIVWCYLCLLAQQNVYCSNGLCQPGPPSGAWEVLDVYCSAYSQINANHNDLLAFFIVVLEVCEKKILVFRSYNTYWLSNFNALCWLLQIKSLHCLCYFHLLNMFIYWLKGCWASIRRYYFCGFPVTLCSFYQVVR